jgi:hypothetical protein
MSDTDNCNEIVILSDSDNDEEVKCVMAKLTNNRGTPSTVEADLSPSPLTRMNAEGSPILMVSKKCIHSSKFVN